MQLAGTSRTLLAGYMPDSLSANAPQDIAFLLAEVERLKAENAAFEKRGNEYTTAAQSLISELASAKADKARLDWLDDNASYIVIETEAGETRDIETSREAIDAARKENL